MTFPDGQSEPSGTEQAGEAEQAAPVAADIEAADPTTTAAGRRPTWLTSTWIVIAVVLVAAGTAIVSYALIDGGQPAGHSAATAGGSSPSGSAGSGGIAGQVAKSRDRSKPAASPSANSSAPPSGAQVAAENGAVAVPASARGAVAKWYKGRGGAELTVVKAQLGAVTQAAATKQYVEMRFSCGQLRSAVRTARHGPPIPASALQKAYLRALGTIAAGSSGCLAAISVQAEGAENMQAFENKAKLNAAMSKFAAGGRYLYRATAEISASSGFHL